MLYDSGRLQDVGHTHFLFKFEYQNLHEFFANSTYTDNGIALHPYYLANKPSTGCVIDIIKLYNRTVKNSVHRYSL